MLTAHRLTKKVVKPPARGKLGDTVLKRLTSLVAFLVWALPAAALTPAEQVIAALEAKGYEVIVQERTWLGRLRIVAVTGDLRRELVINPGTGEILRDFSELRWADSNETGTSGSPDVASSAVEQPVVRSASEPTAGVVASTDKQSVPHSVPKVELTVPTVEPTIPIVVLTAPLVLADPIVVGGK